MSNFEELNAKAIKYRSDNELGSGEVDVYQGVECANKFNEKTLTELHE
jgi:hypothetical protein